MLPVSFYAFDGTSLDSFFPYFNQTNLSYGEQHL